MGRLIDITKHILLENGFTKIGTSISKEYKGCDIIIDSNDIFSISIYNSMNSKNDLVKVDNIISHFTPAITRGDLEAKDYKDKLLNYLHSSVDNILKAYENLKDFPKKSEYQYIFGELFDLNRYDMTITFGFFDDEESTSDYKLYEDNDYKFFKVLIEFYYSEDPGDNSDEFDEDKTDRDIEFYEESEAEVEQGINRLKSFTNINPFYQIEADEFMSHPYIKIFVHLLKV